MRPLLLLLLAGCGGVQVQNTYHLHTPDNCQVTIESDTTLDTVVLSRDVQAAEDVLTTGNIFTRESFCRAMGTRIVAVATDTVGKDFVGEDEQGSFDVFEGITLAGHMHVLVHELLHGVDVKDLKPLTLTHDGWNDRSHYPAGMDTFNGLQQRYLDAVGRTDARLGDGWVVSCPKCSE